MALPANVTHHNSPPRSVTQSQASRSRVLAARAALAVAQVELAQTNLAQAEAELLEDQDLSGLAFINGDEDLQLTADNTWVSMSAPITAGQAGSSSDFRPLVQFLSLIHI